MRALLLIAGCLANVLPGAHPAAAQDGPAPESKPGVTRPAPEGKPGITRPAEEPEGQHGGGSSAPT